MDAINIEDDDLIEVRTQFDEMERAKKKVNFERIGRKLRKKFVWKPEEFKIEDLDDSSSESSNEGPPKRFHLKTKSMFYFGIKKEDLYLKDGKKTPVDHVGANINLARHAKLLK